MDRAEQRALVRRLLAHLSDGTTDMARDVYRNEVLDYTSAEQHARERSVLFRGHPLVMGLSGDIRRPGDYLTDDFAEVPVLLVRDDEGRARAFMNVCRHRGARVAEGRGHRRRFVCPYHAWVYARDGRLERIPFPEGFPCVAEEVGGLVELPVVERYGLVWARLTPGASFDIEPWLSGLERDLAAFGLESYEHYETRTLERRMNWKLVVDTFLESYHIRTLHRGTIDTIIHSNAGVFDAFGRNSRSIYPRTSMDECARLPEEDRDLVRHTAMVYVLFPNTVFIMQGDHVETWRIYPDAGDPDLSRMYVSLYTPEPATTDSARRHWDRNMDLLMAVVEEQDFPVGERIQAGFHSGAQEHIVFGRNEPALGHYHQAVRDALAEAA